MLAEAWTTSMGRRFHLYEEVMGHPNKNPCTIPSIGLTTTRTPVGHANQHLQGIGNLWTRTVEVNKY